VSTFWFLVLLSLIGAAHPQPPPVTVAVCEGEATSGGTLFYASEGRIVRLLTVEGAPLPPDCASLPVPFQAEAIQWMGLVPFASGGEPVTHISLQGSFASQVRVSEVDYGPEPPPFPPLLPFQTDVLTILPPESLPTAMRSAWLWSPDLWLDLSERIWEVAEDKRIGRLFLTIPVGPGGVENAAVLHAFVAEASGRGIAIWAVIGDPHDVLESSIDALRARTDAYLLYNASAPEGAELSGLQLDIEPHLLPGFSLAQSYWRERYLSTVLSIHGRIAGRLPLDLVVPVWWGAHPDWGEAFLQGLVAPDLSLTIMNYRTATGPLGAGARPFLSWGRDTGVPVSIGLEAGSIGPDEVRRSYERVEDGSADLLLVHVGEHRVLLLVDGAHSGSGAHAYRMIRENPAPASAITFAGDMDRLEATALQMETAWKAWSSYAGLAIHGLDELYFNENNPGE